MSTPSAAAKPSKSSPPTSPSPIWLQPLGLTRDSQTWTYLSPSGQPFPVSVTQLIGAVNKTEKQIEAIMASKATWEPRGNTLHQTLEAFVNQRWNPNPPPDLQAPPPGDYAEWIEPLIASPLWDRITVVGSEVMAYSTRRNVAGTADLVIQFPDGSFGIADLKTQSSKTSQPYDTKPQLGAGVEMIGDLYHLPISRCLTLWSRPGSLTIQTHTADECLQAWFNACEEYAARFRPW
jgi:hypothetical protein